MNFADYFAEIEKCIVEDGDFRRAFMLQAMDEYSSLCAEMGGYRLLCKDDETTLRNFVESVKRNKQNATV